MPVAMWKSGASAPRKASGINTALAQVVALSVPRDFFRSLLERYAE
jgi:hypothetical protein